MELAQASALASASKIRVSTQRDIIYARTIVRAIRRDKFSAAKHVSALTLPHELIEDITQAAGWQGGVALIRCARQVVRNAVNNALAGPSEIVPEGEPCVLHYAHEFPALQSLIGELLLSGARRRRSMELQNLPRCSALPDSTDAPSVTTPSAQGSPSEADSAASLTDALVGMVP